MFSSTRSPCRRAKAMKSASSSVAPLSTRLRQVFGSAFLVRLPLGLEAAVVDVAHADTEVDRERRKPAAITNPFLSKSCSVKHGTPSPSARSRAAHGADALSAHQGKVVAVGHPLGLEQLVKALLLADQDTAAMRLWAPSVGKRDARWPELQARLPGAEVVADIHALTSRSPLSSLARCGSLNMPRAPRRMSQPGSLVFEVVLEDALEGRVDQRPVRLGVGVHSGRMT